jgi:peptide/nickel transport system permease protein
MDTKQVPESLQRIEVQIPDRPLWRIRAALLWESFKSNWKLFKRNRVGLVGLVIIILFALLGLAQPILFATGVWDTKVYDVRTGNDTRIRIAEMTVVANVDEVVDPTSQIDRRRLIAEGENVQVGDVIQRELKHPWPPDRYHLLGTDPNGSDILSQLMYGARAAFGLGLLAAFVTVFIATTVGSVAAYFGGWVDSFFMRFADLLLMLPILAVLIVASSFGRFKLWHLAIFLGLLGGFGGTAIVLKSQALSVKVKPFIDAARVAGGNNWRIVTAHLIPNVMPLSFLYVMFSVTGAISSEAVLSFLGLLNIQMSWGLMINKTQSAGYLLNPATWWLIVPAGLAVTLLAGAFYLAGRGMDEIINPRLRNR